MAKVIIGAEVKVEGLDKAGQSVGNFKKQLKEATQDLQNMADKFGLNSKEAEAAARKVAGLKDAIGDAKALADTFNPDKKFVALGGAVQGAVAGFSALTGVMGLFGTESKEVEKLLLKVQSAMLLQQGISGIKGAIDSFKLLGAAIKSSTAFQAIFSAGTTIAAGVQRAFGFAVTTTSTAFKTLRAAIISTGIGALIVGVGLLINKIIEWTSATESQAEKQERLNKALEESNRITKEYFQVIDRETEVAIKRAKIRGASEAEITRITAAGIVKRIELLDKDKADAIMLGAETAGIDKEILENKQALQDLYLDQELKRAEAGRVVKKEVVKKAAKEEKDEAKYSAEELLALKREYQQKEKESTDAYFAAQAEYDAQQEENHRQALRNEQERTLQVKAELAELALLDDPDSIDNRILKINADLELELFALAEGDLRRQILAKQASNAIVQIKQEEADAKKKIGEAEMQAAMSVATGIANALDAFAAVAGKQTMAGKVLAIASTVIKTIQGGIAAFTGMVSSIPGPVGIALGVVAAAGVVASGVAAIAKMKAVQIPGQAGGGGGNTSIPLPAAPISPQAQTTQLNQGSINAVGNAANRAYVLETDVSGNQERIRRLNRSARIN